VTAGTRHPEEFRRTIPTLPARLPGEMWAITACFNPAGYKNKYDHLERFSAAVRAQGLKLLVVELAIRGQPFAVPDATADRVIRLSSDTVLWHKERLLNIAVSALPADCDKVAWVDADLLFENANWVAETCDLLERYMVVQPFSDYCFLAKGVLPAPFGPDQQLTGSESLPSLAFARLVNDLSREAHALPGGAWTARRWLIEKHGLYDRFILGGGDAAMAWAMYGLATEWQGAWGWFNVVMPGELMHDLGNWSDGFHRDVQGSVYFTPGRVFHLWHGDRKQRRYVLRFLTLRKAGFDPATDLALDGNRCWRWNSDKPGLHREVEEYFRARKEEG
jgi:hypothetical protein